MVSSRNLSQQIFYNSNVINNKYSNKLAFNKGVAESFSIYMYTHTYIIINIFTATKTRQSPLLSVCVHKFLIAVSLEVSVRLIRP